MKIKRFQRIITGFILMLTLISGQTNMPDWWVDPAQYEFTGTITAAVYIGDNPVGAAGDLVAGFLNGECRGVADALITPDGSVVFMLVLYGNSAAGDTLDFMYYNAVGDEVMVIDETALFSDNMELGAPDTPFIFHALPEDCAGVPGGSAFIDECGYCVGGDTGLLPGFADVGCGCDVPAALTYCEDTDGDGLGNPGTESVYCLQNLPAGWVIDCSDPEPDCFTNDTDCAGSCGGSAVTDECGVCCGGGTGEECAWFNNESDYGGAFDCTGTCFGNTEPDCLGICGGDSVCFPVVQPAPSALNPGDIHLDESLEEAISVYNAGTADYLITSVSVPPPFDSVISLNLSAATVAPGEASVLTVVITPDEIGQFSTLITITGNTDDVIIPVEYSVISPQIFTETTSLDFGSVLTGFASDMSLEIINAGVTPLYITDIQVSDSPVFTSDFQNDITIQPDESHTVTFTFSPVTTGWVNGSAVIVNNDAPLAVSLWGTGVTPQLSLPVTDADAGSVLLGETGSIDLQIMNAGNYELAVLNIELTGGAGQFSFTADMSNIPPLSGNGLTVAFSPSATGLQQAQIQVSSTGGNGVINLSGTGITLPPQVTAAVADITVNEDDDPFVAANMNEVFTDDFGPLSFSVETDAPQLLTAELSPDGQVLVTLMENRNGSAAVTLTASDEANTAVETFFVNVIPVPDPVTAVDAQLTGDLNNAIEFELEASDPDGDDLLFSILTPPVHGAVSGEPPSLEYTPDFNYFGGDSLIFTVWDGLFSDTGRVDITINPAEFQLAFQVDLSLITELGLFRPDQGMAPVVSVADGFFPGVFPLQDEDGDGVWSAEVTQGIPDVFHYVFAIDPDGGGDPDAFVYELDPPETVRTLATSGFSDYETLPPVVFDNWTPGLTSEPSQAIGTQYYSPASMEERNFESGASHTAVSVGFSALDRNLLVAVQRYSGLPEGEYPGEIIVPGSNGWWRIESIPRSAVFTADMAIRYNLLTGIGSPEDLRILNSTEIPSMWETVPSELRTWENAVVATDVSHFSYWTLGSVTDENSLLPVPPQAATSPTPIENDVNIDRTPRLSWQPDSLSLWHSVYLWAAGDPEPETPIIAYTSDIFYQIENNLWTGTTYFWKVVSANLYGEALSETWQFTVQALPDLQVTDIQVSQMVAGQTFEVSWTVTNMGASATNAPQWFDFVWLSPDMEVRIGESEDILLGTFQNISYLEPGMSYTNSAEVTLPLENIGSYYIFVITDEIDAVFIDFDNWSAAYHSASNSNLVLEENSNNNFNLIEVDILPPSVPDLIVSDLTVQNTGISNQEINISWTVTNDSDVPTTTDNWWDAALITQDSDTGNDLMVMGTAEHTGILLPGDSYTVTTVMTLPHPMFGEEYIHIKTDYYDQIFEYIYEANNLSQGEVITVYLQPPPDLTVVSVSHPAETTILRPEYFDFTVHNQGAGTTEESDWVDCLYFSYNDELNPTSDVLIASLPHHGILNADSSYTWEGILNVPDNIGGEGFIFVSADCQAQVFEHFFENNNVTRSAETMTVHLPDLVTFDIAYPDTVHTQDTVQLAWWVTNSSDTDTEDSQWTDCIYLAPVETADNSSDVLIGTVQRNGALASGETYSVQTAVTIPHSIGGEYEFYVMTDCDENVYEGDNEVNNAMFGADTMEVLTPDLFITENDLPSSVGSGETMTLTYTVQNGGAADIIDRQWAERLVLSESPLFDPDSAALAAGINWMNNSLISGESYSGTISMNIPRGISGNYYIHLVTDGFDYIHEYGAEANNIISQPLEIQLSPWPDLHVTQVAIPDTIVSGSIFNMTWTIKNEGNLDLVNQSWTDNVYISPTAYFENLTPLSGQFISALTINSGDSVQVTHSIVVSSFLPPGDYYIYVKTDATDNIYEYTGETNNISQGAPVYIDSYPEADLLVTQFTAPDSVLSGSTVSVDWSAANTGDVYTLFLPTANNWYDMVYISDDEILDEEDMLLQYSIRENLAPGESYSTQFSIPLPGGVFGDKYFIVKVDNHHNIINDYHLDNNVAVRPVHISLMPAPDLFIEYYIPVNSGTAGQPVHLTWTVKNIGETATSTPISDDVYVSGNTTLGAGDIHLGSFIRQAPVGTGESYTAENDVTLPNYLSGTYYILIKTDGNDTIYEYNGEDNNLVSFPVTISYSLPADLVVTDITVPPTAFPGDEVQVQWTIQNIGDYPATGFLRDGIYFSQNDQWELEDPMLGYVDRYIDLAPEETLRMEGTVQITRSFREDSNGNIVEDLPGMAPGDYHVIIRTDLMNSIFEIYNNNNEMSSVELTTVDLPQLPLNESVGTDLPRNGILYYKISVEEDNDLRIILDSQSEEAGNEVYIAYGYVPTLIDYDMAANTPFMPGQELLVPSTQGGNYYLLIYSRYLGGAEPSQPVFIMAQSLPFSFFNMSPDRGGMDGKVTCTVNGAGFRPNTLAYLRMGSDSLLIADNIQFVNTMELRVRWDLTDVPLGAYNLVLENEETRAQLEIPGAFIVEESQGYRIDYYSNSPDFIRASHVGSLDLFFTNPSNIDIPYASFSMLFENTVNVIDIDCSDEFTNTQNGDIMGDCTPPNCGEVYSFIDSSGHSYKMIQKTAVNIPPGVTANCRIKFKTTFLDVINVSVSGEIMTPNTFYDNMLWSLNRMREDLIELQDTPEFETVPAEVADLLDSPAAFLDFGLSALINGGLVDAGGLGQYLGLPGDYGDQGYPGNPPGNGGGGDNGGGSGGNGGGDGGSGGNGGGGSGGSGPGGMNGGNAPGGGLPFNPDLPPGGGFNPGDFGGPGSPPGGGGQGGGNAGPSCGPGQQIASEACNWMLNKACGYLGGKLLGNPCPAICAPLAPTFFGYIACYIACKVAWDKLTDRIVKPLCQKLTDNVCPRIIKPCDPNEIIGPPGYGDPHWVNHKDRLDFTINFENDPEYATAPAQTVVIEMDLDEDTDPGSFRLGDFGFADYIFSVPENMAYYTDRIDLRDSLNIFLDVNAGIDVNANRAFWIFETVDPLTGEAPQDPFTGFLAVNDSITHRGEGFAGYSLRPAQNAVTGDVIESEAAIVFDINEPVFTPLIFHTVDAVPPVSEMNGAYESLNDTTITLSWSGYDDEGGSGLAFYRLFSAVDLGGFILLADELADTSFTLTLSTGHYYRFFTQAVDHSGNEEELKLAGEVFVVSGDVLIAPVIDSAPVVEAWEDSVYIYPVSAVYPDSSAMDFIRYRLDLTPDWLEIDSLSGVITGIPSAEDVGLHDVIVTAYDDFTESQPQNFVLTVYHVNHVPVINAEPVLQVEVGEPYYLPLTGTDPDSTVFGDSLYFTAPVLPAWMTLELAGGNLLTAPGGHNQAEIFNSLSGDEKLSGEAILPDDGHIKKTPARSAIRPGKKDNPVKRSGEQTGTGVFTRAMNASGSGEAIRTWDLSAALTGLPDSTSHGFHDVLLVLHDNTGGTDSLAFTVNVYVQDDLGCTDPQAFNFDPEATLDDGTCLYSVTYSRPLHPGANLISYYALPADSGIASAVAGCGGSVLGVIGEGAIAIPHPSNPGEWIGSLTGITKTGGYWVLTENDCSIQFDGTPVDPGTVFSLHAGANLIGYPFTGSAPFTETVPDSVLSQLQALVGEGMIAIPHPVNPGEWLGSLTHLHGADGYWFIASEDADFIYNPPALTRGTAETPPIPVPDEWKFTSSTQQAFYFIEDVELLEGAVSADDWIIAMNGDAVTGARRWAGKWTDIPVMGKDNQTATETYFNDGDTPEFYLWSPERQMLIPLNGEISTWSNLGVSFISKLSEGPVIPDHFALHPAYPNPFNPDTQMKYELPVDSHVKITVYNMLGQEVARLRDGMVPAGYHTVVWHVENLSSGMYFIVFRADPADKSGSGSFVKKQKVMILK